MAAVNQLPGAGFDAARDTLIHMRAAGVLGALPATPVFHYRARDGSARGHMNLAALWHELRTFISSPVACRGASDFTLRSLRPGGGTDVAAAGVPAPPSAQGRQWASEHGMVPYNRVDHYVLQGLSSHRTALLAIQQQT